MVFLGICSMDPREMHLLIDASATPHHGSSVLSEPEYVQAVRQHLHLKWEMPQRLRQDFRPKNPDLEFLNYKFAATALGVKLYSYIETQVTEMQVLSNSASAGKALTSVGLCIVDGRSARLSTPQIPVDDEVIIELPSTHTGTTMFYGGAAQKTVFLNEVAALIQSFSADERAAYQSLHSSIMNDVKVDIHQFYESENQGDATSMKVWSEHPSIKIFFDLGPTACLSRRLGNLGQGENGLLNGISNPKIQIAIQKSSPTITAAFAPQHVNQMLRKQASAQNLAVPSFTKPLRNGHIRRISLDPNFTFKSPRPRVLVPPQNNLQSNKLQFQGPHKEKPPQRSAAYNFPTHASDRFKWIHVPFTHCGWVPVSNLINPFTVAHVNCLQHVLRTVSQDKANRDLHAKLLLDSVWISQHNRSRHASPHAQFIRPSVKFLLPEGT